MKTQARTMRSRLRGVPLTIQQILAWADAHHERTGDWPKCNSGPIEGSSNTWQRINGALYHGCRGLPGGVTLVQLLAKHRGVKKIGKLPRLTLRQIHHWAEEHLKLTGKWPTTSSGRIHGTQDETWLAVDGALRAGCRGLSTGWTLKSLLQHRSSRRLTIPQILTWVDAYRERTGTWPKIGPKIADEASGRTWASVDAALRHAVLGLPSGSSLPKLLAKFRGVRKHGAYRLTVDLLLAWADAHYEQTGKWPRVASGRVRGAAGETWRAIDRALRRGSRGLEGGSSLLRLLARHRPMRLRESSMFANTRDGHNTCLFRDKKGPPARNKPTIECGIVLSSSDWATTGIDGVVNN